jgi:hypothetical protein
MVIGIFRDPIIMRMVEEISKTKPAVRKTSTRCEIADFLCSINTAME